jgi:hypothetical protein
MEKESCKIQFLLGRGEAVYGADITLKKKNSSVCPFVVVDVYGNAPISNLPFPLK